MKIFRKRGLASRPRKYRSAAPGYRGDLMEFDKMAMAVAIQFGAGSPVRDSWQYAEAWLGLCEAAKRFRPALGYRFTTFAGWYMWGMVQSHRARRLSKDSPERPGRAHIPFSCLVGDTPHEFARASEVLGEVSRRELAELVRRAVGQLPRPQRQVAEIYFALDGVSKGHSSREVAARLGIGKYCALRRLEGIRQRLRESLGPIVP
jgi:RNA polymerase sigma factor (sigma-70 family)